MENIGYSALRSARTEGSMGCSSGKAAVSELSERDRTIVKDSWRDLKAKKSTTDLGVIMFTKLFDENPDVMALFTFMQQDGASPSSESFRKHATGVMDTLGVAVSAIDDFGKLGPVVRELGSKHYSYGAQVSHLKSVGTCIMYSFQLTLEKEFTTEVRNAWLAFYSIIGRFFQEGLEEGRKQG